MRIWIDNKGNIGNRAIQYLAAQGICHYSPGSVIDNIDLPEWGLKSVISPPSSEGSLTFGAHRFWINSLGVADCLRRGVIKSVVMDSYAQHIDNFPPKSICQKLLSTQRAAPDAVGFGPHELLCSIRGGEVLHGIHADYVVLPASFYKMLAQRTGLQLVFFGQLDENAYVASLRGALPDAKFVMGRSPEFDFHTIRRSVNIVPSVSTFAWLAAWLSDAKRVILPVAGFLNPAQGRTNMSIGEPKRISLLPLNDSNYEFVLFPFTHSINMYEKPKQFENAQMSLSSAMRAVMPEELEEICSRLERYEPEAADLQGFDARYYLQRYPDVAIALDRGLISAAHHYLHYGVHEGRFPFEFDEDFYLSSYPEAGVEISNGRFRNTLEHYVRVGRSQGYSIIRM